MEDFGIYNVAGGVITLFYFFSGALYSACNRFFTFDLGKGDFNALSRTFSMSITVHFLAAVLLLFLGETVGLWFLNSQLNIPTARMDAANWVYQLSIVSACMGILRIPYESAIIAHERMSFFAYLGIVESVLKLVIVLLLAFIQFDSLIIYAILMLLVSVVIFLCNKIYCKKYFAETLYELFWNKKMFAERIKFMGWNVLGGTAAISASQGVNMLLNVFYGVAANAAMGIMNQVNGAVNMFTSNLFTAFNPQIIQSYARSDNHYLNSLIVRSSKFCVLSFFALAVPLVLNMPFVLQLWLKTVPEYAIVFCQIGMVNIAINMLSRPLNILINTTGNIRNFQIADSVLMATGFVIAYLFLKAGFSPELAVGVCIG